MNMRILMTLLLLALAGNGCAYLHHPVATRIFEERSGHSASAARLLVMNESLDWVSSEQGEKYEISLPEGIYHVEARDDDYLFYLAPQRVTLGAKEVFPGQDGSSYDGGIFASRRPNTKYALGAYIDYHDGKRLLLFKLDSRFTKLENESWHYVGQ